MSPTSDDLRALLSERADSGQVTAPFDANTAARLAGVHARVRQRQRARLAAGALALALFAVGAGVTTVALSQGDSSAPAHRDVHQEPRRDPDGRPLAVTLRTASGVQDGVEASPSSVRLDSPASGLRLTGSCVGSPGTTGFVLVNGRVTARLECGGAAADVVVPAVSRDGNLEYDQPVTVTVRLAASGADGLPDFAARVLPPATAQVDVYSSAGVAPSPAAASVSSRGPGRPVVPVLLAGQTVPLGAGPHAFSVVVGSDRFDIADRCRAPATKAPLWVHLTVNGRPVTSATCGTGDTGATLVGRTPGTLTASDLGVVVGRPATVTFQLSTAADRIVDPPDDHGDGDVGFAVYGVPYVPPSLARPAPASGSSAGASEPTVSAP